MAYSVDDLIGQFRTQMDDNVEPFLWDEDRIIEWIDEAQKVFAEKTKYFQGSESIAALVVDGGYFAIPEYVFELRRAKLASQTTPLQIENFNTIDTTAIYTSYGYDLHADWEALTGSPKLLVLDERTGFGRLIPKPQVDETVKIHYARLPLKDVTASSSKIELTDTRHQRLLVTYARAMAYGDHDADVYDPRAEASKMEEFHEKLNELAYQVKRKTRRAGVVKYGGL